MTAELSAAPTLDFVGQGQIILHNTAHFHFHFYFHFIFHLDITL